MFGAMQTANSNSDQLRFLVVAGDAQAQWARLKRAFSKCPEIVLIRTTAKEDGVIEECRKLLPCVLLVDFGFIAELQSPADFAQKIGFGSLVPVLVLTDRESEEALEILVRVGCRGFMRPESPPWQFRRAVQSVAAGELWAPRKFISNVVRNLLSANNPRKLTAREAEIVTLVSQGYTNKEAAEALCISRETVRWHMRMVYGKLGVHDRLSAALRVEGHAARIPPTAARRRSTFQSDPRQREKR